MKKEISDRYEPQAVEQKWIKYWEDNKSFQVDYSKKDPFSIVIPPPNVTGTLHIGHALNHTIQDIIIRIERKKGKAAVWVPGMDHAGIATQVVVEKQLAANKQSRTDFTRDEFINKVWKWKKESGDGKKPMKSKLKTSDSFSKQSVEDLEKLLAKVLEEEDYKKAAKIRDEINKRKSV